MGLAYLLFAIFALGILVFIHELGHYFMALKEGMEVEVFSIGLGKAIYQWERKGIKWQIGWLPFGGYVRIRGMERKGQQELHELEGGFFSKSPWARIKVCAMGPIVNLVFAFLVFALLWVLGGREKPFSAYTQGIGWVNENSEIYQKGVRPGDLLTTYNGYPYKGYRDLVTLSILKQPEVSLEGEKINYQTGEKTPFSVVVHPYSEGVQGMHTVGITSPRSYLIYQGSPLPKHSPMVNSGIQSGDRVVWMDGEWIFSPDQVSHLLNATYSLVTINRNDQTLLVQVPRVLLSDLRLEDHERDEFRDSSHEMGLSPRLGQLFVLPYRLNHLKVEGSYLFEGSHEKGNALQGGDEILAIDGTRVQKGKEIFQRVQEHKVHVIVERGGDYQKPTYWNQADIHYAQGMNEKDLEALTATIGTNNLQKESGNLHLLNPVEPKRFAEVYPPSPDQLDSWDKQLATLHEKMDEMEDPKEKQQALQYIQRLKDYQNRLVLGVPLQDRLVIYNPYPWFLFRDAFQDTGKTLGALVRGYLSPKWLSGPVGIVQGIQQSGALFGLKEALYWVGLISFNLGFLNLLPIPLLDGGYIFLSLIEAIIRRPIRAKVLERLFLPFVFLMIGFFIFVTFHDISRLFDRLFS